MKSLLPIAAVLALSCAPSQAAIVISEWMYGDSVLFNEFVELTNTGLTPVDFTGWSFDDASRTAGLFSLSALGVVQSGQSVIIAEDSVANFRAYWGIGSEVTVIGGNTQNLGRSDEMNIYDASNNLVVRLTYNDQAALGPRTNNSSAVTSAENFGVNNAALWHISQAGVDYGARLSVNGQSVGSPGVVPEPASAALLGLGGLLAFRRRRK